MITPDDCRDWMTDIIRCRKEQATDAFNMALIYADLGDAPGARDFLNRALQNLTCAHQWQIFRGN